MARSPAEIQTDIALTRQQIEDRLDALQRQMGRRWWALYALLGAGLLTGMLLARVPVITLLAGGARAVQAGASVAAALAAIDRVAARRRTAELRGSLPQRSPRPGALSRAS